MVEWANEKLENLMLIQTGSKNTEDNKVGGKYPFFVRSQQVEHIDTYSFDCEAVLTAGDGVGTGKVFHYINGKFDAHQRVYVMSNFTGIDGKYFYYYFSENFLDEVHKFTAKSSVDSVRRAMIAEMQIPLPPLSEQRAIAIALSDADEYIAALERLIAKKRDIKKGAMQELFHQKVEWEEKPLKEYVSDFIVPMRDKPKELDGNIPWCRIEDFDGKYLFGSKSNQGVSLETVKLMNLKIFPVNTLLVSCSAHLGECAITKRELITNQTFIGLVPNKKVSVEWLFYAMQREEQNLNNIASGTTISYLSREQFENYILRFPTLKEQNFIAEVLSDMDVEINALTAKLNKVKLIKQGMMEQLLTGKIRLEVKSNA